MLATPVTELGQVQMKKNHVYILASQYNGTLYIGITSDLAKHIWENKNKSAPRFTAQYNIAKLVYYEILMKFSICRKDYARWVS